MQDRNGDKRFPLFLAFVLSLVMAFCLPLAARAQNTPTLDGVVHDPTGAVIPKAKIQLKYVATNEVRETQSNEVGVFSLDFSRATISYPSVLRTFKRSNIQGFT
jgi:hypothetical protein